MGTQIAEVCARVGYETYVYDISEEALKRLHGAVEKSLRKYQVERGKMKEEEVPKVLEMIKAVGSLEEAAGEADFVIEAVFERLDVKQEVFRKLDEVCKPEAILGTNTSTLSITAIASATKSPHRVVGTHFLNPAQLTRAIELCRGLLTSDEAFNVTVEFCKRLGKEVIVSGETPGFIINRLWLIALNEAIRLYAEGVASREEIDKAARIGLAWPLGPFEAMDRYGLDIIHDALMGIYEQLQDPRYYPHPLLKRMVSAGLLGVKTKRGWYSY